MSEQPIGPILDGLGVTIDLEAGDLIESAIVVAKVVNTAGQVTIAICDSAGMDWLNQLGLVVAAHQIVTDRPFDHPDGCD